MPLDPQAEAVLKMRAALNLPPMDTLTPDQARKQMNAQLATAPPGPVLWKVEDAQVPSQAGSILVRIYRPRDGVLPALVYFHGGGWVVGSVETHDATARWLAAASDCAVVSVEYRLAPEDRFPAAADDSYAATRWVAENAGRLNLDPDRLAVGGDSAGGNLAAAVALMARDRGGPRISHQLLIYPVTDCDFDTPSYIANATDYGLTRASMRWFWDQYAPGESDRTNPYASPMRAGSLKGLPPAHIITAEYDPLRDDGAAYAEALKRAGVTVEYRCYEGVCHGFLGLAHVLDKAQTAIEDSSSMLRKRLGVASTAQTR